MPYLTHLPARSLILQWPVAIPHPSQNRHLIVNIPKSVQPHRSTVAAYLELMRLPNVFTAMADVVMGFLFTHAVLTRAEVPLLLLLMAASSCLYLAGMILNDVFDVDVDRQRRPGRPLPSGRIPLPSARRLGWLLLAAGVLLAWLAALSQQSFRPGIIGLALAAFVVLYDAWLKRTPLGPVSMGACRLLNVLLGMSLAASSWQDQHWLVAGAIGTYITGVTWFARTETARSSRWQLAMATVVLLAGVALLVQVPDVTEDTIELLALQPQRWLLLISVLGALIGFRCFRAVLDPSPLRVQIAVRQCLLSLVILDAAVCFVTWGTPGAAGVLALLIPTVIFGQWVNAT